ncbi:hypothetical protein KCV06_g95, partial [Aureobasidium melanogenum]
LDRSYAPQDREPFHAQRKRHRPNVVSWSELPGGVTRTTLKNIQLVNSGNSRLHRRQNEKGSLTCGEPPKESPSMERQCQGRERSTIGVARVPAYADRLRVWNIDNALPLSVEIHNTIVTAIVVCQASRPAAIPSVIVKGLFPRRPWSPAIIVSVFLTRRTRQSLGQQYGTLALGGDRRYIAHLDQP